MTTQPTTKAQSALDWLCWVLIIFGALCLVASVPQTFTMVRVAHDEFGSAILVVVLEVMAFFALLAPLWVPAWTKTFDRIAYTLLGITTLGNYAGGWNYVWTHNEVGPFWMSIRDWRDPILDLPLATILLVGALSGLVPFAMKFFISLAIKRYRENELDRSPEAVAQRAIEPVLVQIIATQRLQEQLLMLAEQTRQPLVLPGKAPSLTDLDYTAEMERILAEREAQRREGEQRRPFEPVGLSPDELAMVTQAVQKAQVDEQHSRWEEPGLYGGYTEAEYNCKGCFGPCGMCETDTQATVEASDDDKNDREQDWSEEEEHEPEVTRADALAALAEKGIERLTPDELLALPDGPEREAEFKRRIGNSVDRGLNWLVEKGFITRKQPAEDASVEATQPPAGMPLEENPTDGMGGAPEPLLGASTRSSGELECELCGEPAVNSDKAACKRGDWPKKLDGKLACKSCREKLR